MKKKKISNITVICKIFVAVLLAAPGWIGMDCAAMLLSSVCYAFSTVVKQWLFDTIAGVVNGQTEYAALILVTFFVVLFQIGNELLNAVCNFTWSPALKSIERKLKQKIHKKIAKLPGNSFEDVKVLECIEKANAGAGKCYGVYSSVSTILLFYFPYFLVMGIYLYRIKPVLILALLFIFLPLVINLFVRQRVFEKQMDEITPLQREKEYYETEIFSRDTLKENRLYGSYSFFKKKFTEVNQLFCKKRWRAAKRTGIIEVSLRLLTLAGYLGVILLLIFSMLDGSVSIGVFAAVFSSISTLIMFMNDAISNHLSSLFDNMGPLRRYLEFFDLPEERNGGGEIQWRDTVRVRNISYTYPETDKKVLDNVSFDIQKGETVAVVGENGAGKSTLVRILSGILIPDKGEILADGKSIFEISPDGRFKNISAVFQNFIKYQMSVRENVEISSETAASSDVLKSCMEKSEFVMDERFTDGYDTMLSKEFDGIDLSGGQWQRLALARGLYRKSRFMILDEPTSAIDPIEEGVLYRKFRDFIKDKIGIIVTHRLGSAKIADKILVLKDGKLAEFGTHAQLMEQKGYYATLYMEQAKWYRE